MNLIFAICISSFMFTAITAVFSILAYAKVVGMEKSTHQIQYVPMETPGQDQGQTAQELAKNLYPEYEDNL